MKLFIVGNDKTCGATILVSDTVHATAFVAQHRRSFKGLCLQQTQIERHWKQSDILILAFQTPSCFGGLVEGQMFFNGASWL